MRQRYNIVIVDHRDQSARLVWVEEGEILEIAAYEEPFSIISGHKLVDVEIAVEHDVREFALRERQN